MGPLYRRVSDPRCAQPSNCLPRAYHVVADGSVERHNSHVHLVLSLLLPTCPPQKIQRRAQNNRDDCEPRTVQESGTDAPGYLADTGTTGKMQVRRLPQSVSHWTLKLIKRYIKAWCVTRRISNRLTNCSQLRWAVGAKGQPGACWMRVCLTCKH